MACYYCHECDNYFDNDWVLCEVNPFETTELVCPECWPELHERYEQLKLALVPQETNDGC